MDVVLMVVLMVGVVVGLLGLLFHIERKMDAWEGRIDAESEDD